MTLPRVLKYVNILIGAALAALGAAAYWFAWRPLPKIQGEIRAPVAARAVVSRDRLGVPHILAANQADALFVQGYVTAQDRLFQMDALRRSAAGELAEIAGRGALESDRLMRRMRLARLAQEGARRLPAEDRAALAAYARGVNHFMETHRGRLPLEFSLLGYDPRPWSLADSILVFLNMAVTLEDCWPQELRKEALLAGGDPAKVDFLYASGWVDDTPPGSNAWALSGALTASRRPILAGDPHLEFTIPSIWHMAHIRGPRLNVSGVALPGLPGIVIGHNDRIAWSVTSLEADTQDLYIEKLNPANGLYQYAGRTEQARAGAELIRIKGGNRENLMVWSTRHGPVLVAEGGRFLSLRWTMSDMDGFAMPVLDINRARNWEEFRAALGRLPGPALNFVYADAAGNIGYQAVGRLPLRKGYDGSLPADGASGEFDWRGVMPFDKLPSTFNPPGGMIVSANQDPFPAGSPDRAPGYYAPPYRFRQIRDRLRAKAQWNAAEMLSIQMDIYSGFAHFLAREILAAYERRGSSYPALAEAVRQLKGWNGQMSASDAAPMIVGLAYRHLRAALARRVSKTGQPVYTIAAAAAVVERLLRERPPDWFRDYDQLLLDNLSEALEEGRRMQGRDVRKWEYGRLNRLEIVNPVVGRLPVVGRYFNIGEVLMPGSAETPRQKPLGSSVSPSMRMVVDFADLDRSLLNIPAGQSGQVLSRHYRDQWNAYMAGRSYPMQFHKIEAEATLVFLPEGR
ncbi:MAG: penicillin acylase family protein [Bryobacterales bacterium]|nr:penicillin acylase family protein [Bryobacterales bacterium]